MILMKQLIHKSIISVYHSVKPNEGCINKQKLVVGKEKEGGRKKRDACISGLEVL